MLTYDKNSVDSIYDFAKKLTGKSLSELVDVPGGIDNSRNRGDLGSLIEKYFFGFVPPNTHEPDFPDAGEFGVELKTTGVKKIKGKYRAKERLVMTMIDYKKIIDEKWENSVFYKKCRLLLILFYLYEKDIPVQNRKFVLDPLLYSFLTRDEEVIRRDWETIKDKIVSGKAHELSEGDTIFLGACRKGSGGASEKLRSQPKSTIKAKARAFSFKPEFLNSILDEHISGKLAPIETRKGMSFEEITLKKFEPYLGKTLNDICKSLNYSVSKLRDKSFEAKIVKRILEDGQISRIDLDRAGIIVKTVRLRNGKLKESISFPSFKFLDIVKGNWEDSDLFNLIERKFLFVVVEISSNKDSILKSLGYWNMPYSDRQEVEKVWLRTKNEVAKGAKNLPKQSESNVVHVRPHARNRNDVLITPKGNYEVKRSFWLNREYVEKIINKF